MMICVTRYLESNLSSLIQKERKKTMSDLTPQPIRTTKSGTSKTDKKSKGTPKITEEIRSAPTTPWKEKETRALSQENIEVRPAKEEDGDVPIIANYQDFQAAVSKAQMQGEDGDRYVEVTDVFFKLLTKGKNTPYISYGNPTVKVFREGTVDEIEKSESRSADEVAGLVRSQR